MRCVISLSALLLAGLAATAHAQGRGTQAEQDACTPDVFRLCSAYIPSEPSIIACLQSNKRNLSQNCHAVFFPRRANADLDMTPTGSIGVAKLQKKASRPHHRVAFISHRAMRARR